MADSATPLTALAHGGGCGCKLSPTALAEILRLMPVGPLPADLLVGTETGDDAAVWRLNEDQALVATTDFFIPVVDDPIDFGRIAATNALSDIYAMGGRPIMALAIVGMPLGKACQRRRCSRSLPAVLSLCAAAGVPVAGGHSIDSAEPIYGLAAIGLVRPDRVMRNSTGQLGDCLILGKPLGVGIYSAALKRGVLRPAQYQAMLQSTTQLNAVGAELADIHGVHAMTDVTGFGLLGHVLEMCRGANLGARILLDRVPLLPGIETLAQHGIATGAADRNWASYGGEVSLRCPDWQRAILCDPQTSGGLLVAASPADARHVLETMQLAGFASAAIIGTLVEPPVAVTVT